MGKTDSERMFEAVLCMLILRDGGEIRIPAQLIADVGNAYRFHMRADHETGEVQMVAARIKGSGQRRRTGRR
jgi:hypothetical protein